MKGRLIVSTCGTSVLSNACRQASQQISNFSNAHKSSDVPKDVRSVLEDAITEAHRQLSGANLQQAAKLSAELNALIHFYNFQPFPSQDYHILLHTDTWLGAEAAKLVKAYIQQYTNNVELYHQRDLRTDKLEHLQLGLAELVRDLGPLLSSYREQGQLVIFNLTGGFKSIQGFLQSLAPIYADEVIYIFESQSDLFRIPRLPMKLATSQQVRENLLPIRRLNLHLPVSQMTGLPDLLIIQIHHQYTLSPWGEAIWQQERHILYAEQLWPSPYEKLIFGPNFEKSVRSLPPDRLRQVNERIDDLVKYLTNRQNLNRLDVKQLRGNPLPPSTHECDAWSDQDARRIFMHFEEDTLVLDQLGKGLH